MREGLGRGQLGDVRYEARCVRTFGGAFLAGDWSGFSDLARKQSAWITQHRKEEELSARGWKMRCGIRTADDAFRSRRYDEVNQQPIAVRVFAAAIAAQEARNSSEKKERLKRR